MVLATPPFGASSNIALWRAISKPPVELVVADLELSIHAVHGFALQCKAVEWMGTLNKVLRQLRGAFLIENI